MTFSALWCTPIILGILLCLLALRYPVAAMFMNSPLVVLSLYIAISQWNNLSSETANSTMTTHKFLTTVPLLISGMSHIIMEHFMRKMQKQHKEQQKKQVL